MSDTLCKKCGKPVHGVSSPPYKSVFGGVFLFLIAIALLGFSFALNLKLRRDLRSQMQSQHELREEQRKKNDSELRSKTQEFMNLFNEIKQSNIPESEKTAEYNKIKDAERETEKIFRTQLVENENREAFELREASFPLRIAIVLSIVFASISAMFGTILHWVHLRKIRQLSEKPYFWTAFIGAFILVVPAIWCIILAIFALPLDRGNIPLAIGLTTGNLVAMYTCFNLMRTTYRWVNG